MKYLAILMLVLGCSKKEVNYKDLIGKCYKVETVYYKLVKINLRDDDVTVFSVMSSYSGETYDMPYYESRFSGVFTSESCEGFEQDLMKHKVEDLERRVKTLEEKKK